MMSVLRRRFHPAANICDPSQNPVVPFGANGAGQWTGHPVGLLIVVGILLIALIGVPPIRLFFLLSFPLGVLLGLLLRRCHRRSLDRGEITQFGQLSGGVVNGRSVVWIVIFGLLLIGLLGVPPVNLFVLLALPAGSVVGLFLWWRQAHHS